LGRSGGGSPNMAAEAAKCENWCIQTGFKRGRARARVEGGWSDFNAGVASDWSWWVPGARLRRQGWGRGESVPGSAGGIEGCYHYVHCGWHA